jgi:hypothetical protein
VEVVLELSELARRDRRVRSGRNDERESLGPEVREAALAASLVS